MKTGIALLALIIGIAVPTLLPDSAAALTRKDCENKRDQCYNTCRKAYEGKDTTGDKQLTCAVNTCDFGVYKRCMAKIGIDLPGERSDGGAEQPKPGQPVGGTVTDGVKVK